MAETTINPSTDGWAGYQNVAVNFATVRAANGDLHRDEDDGTSEAIAIRCSGTNFDILRRGQYSVDTSPIGSDVVSAAKVRLFANSKTETLASQALTLCDGGPAGDDALATSDYENNVNNDTQIGDSVALSAITTGQYNEWNFSDLAQIITDGFTKFQLRWESDRANSAPTCASTNAADMNWNFNSAASNKSELVVTHAPAVVSARSYMHFMTVLISLGAYVTDKVSGPGYMTLKNVLKGERVSVFPICVPSP